MTFDTLHINVQHTFIKYLMIPPIFNLDENLHRPKSSHTEHRIQDRYSLVSTGGVLV